MMDLEAMFKHLDKDEKGHLTENDFQAAGRAVPLNIAKCGYITVVVMISYGII